MSPGRLNVFRISLGLGLLGLCLGLDACGLEETGKPSGQILSARWVRRDSVLVYGVLTQTADDRVGVAQLRYKESTYRVFLVHSGPAGFSGKRLLLEADSVVPCGDLRHDDSLVFFSYLPLTNLDGGYTGAACGTDGHADAIWAGRLDAASLASAQVDSAAVRTVLGQYDAASLFYDRDDGMEWSGEGTARTLCVDGRCLGPGG